MTMDSGSSAPTPHLGTDCVLFRSIDTSCLTVTLSITRVSIGSAIGDHRRARIVRPSRLSVTAGCIDGTCIVQTFPMPAPAAPNYIHLDPYHRAVRKRDACLARATTALKVKIALAKLLPGRVSEPAKSVSTRRAAQRRRCFITAPRRSVIDALFHIGSDLRMDDLVRIGWRLAALELVDHVHAANDLADHSVFAVEERAVGEHDEELAVGRVRIGCARHADDAARIGHAGELCLQRRIF